MILKGSSIKKVINPTQRHIPFWQLLPLIGSVLFILLYVLATLYYPGGTNLDKSFPGFSWTQNYWCNLLNKNAINGLPNPARPIALTGMVVLCLTLTAFWYLFPLQAGFKKRERYIIQASGFLTMATGSFIFTSLHDAVITVAGLFGLIALTGTLRGLKKLNWATLFYMGLFVVVLIGLNNLLYYKKNLMYYLPVVQKITFLYFLLWICFINVRWLGEKPDTTGL
ncbi:MAG: hypothetical protein JWN76_3392 [Chitinophagaceae bacterium]|nr:hypothetical protein [Chitinophagaceae bacterium]